MMRTDRIQLAYTLTFLTPFHFGTGLREGILDRTVVRDSGKDLYVPGSTLKGVVREHCEQLARLYQDKENIVDVRTQVVDLHDEKKALWGLSQATSMISRIFGSQQQPGHLYFDDAHQTEQEPVETEVYTQVRLDRPTHTSVPGALFTSEFGIRGFTFNGSIDGWLECAPIKNVDNGPTYSLLLLLAGLCLLDSIGGNKSTGKGRCNCEITSLAVNGENQRQWQSWFDELGALADYANAIREEAQA